MGIHYKQLSVGGDERAAIHRRRLEGKSSAAIAKGLGRPPSTVGRELRRNGGAATRRTLSGAARGRKLAPGTPLWEPVVMDLLRGHSPEQIAGRRKLEHADDPAQRVSHKTIYLALYALPRGDLRKELLAGLR